MIIAFHRNSVFVSVKERSKTMNHARPRSASRRTASGASICCFTLVLSVIAAGFHPSDSGASLGAPESFTALAGEAGKAVVNISTVKTVKTGGSMFRQFHQRPFQGPESDEFNDFFKRFFGDSPQRNFKQQSLGSGFIIDKEGDIVTNNHVIENADEIVVKLSNEKEFKAEIVGRDPNTDLALIRVKAEEDLPFIELGDSDALKVGQWVVAIGNPFGLDHTVTAGIVSAKGRVIGSGPYDDFIQTDASINPGNSGGPLINMAGEVIGINAAIIASGQGIGFAIPINIAKNVVKQLKESGEVSRGWLGVGIQSLDDALAEYYRIDKGAGVLVTEVFPGDPADKAGIRANDILLKVNGIKVDKSRTVSKMIADIPVGRKINITILRDGHEKDFSVIIAHREDQKPAVATKHKAEGESDAFGIHVAELTDELSARFNVEKTEGVIITDVAPDSRGVGADIGPGDIIKEIDHQVIKTLKDYTGAIQKLKKGDAASLVVKRMRFGFVVVKLIR